MSRVNRNPFKYQSEHTTIESGNEQPHHVRMAWFDIIMKWVFKFFCRALAVVAPIAGAIGYKTEIINFITGLFK